MWRRDEIFDFIIGKGHTLFSINEIHDYVSGCSPSLIACSTLTVARILLPLFQLFIYTESSRRKKVNSNMNYGKTFASNRFEGIDSAIRVFFDQMPPLLKMSCGLDCLLHLIPVIPYFLQGPRPWIYSHERAPIWCRVLVSLVKWPKITLPTREMERFHLWSK